VLVSFALTPGATIANGASSNPSLTAVTTGGDMFVAYQSTASNIDATDANNVSDVFRFQLSANSSTRITNGNGASTNPAISEDGAVVAYQSLASSGLITTPAGDTDTNGVSDVFATVVSPHQTTRLSEATGSPGTQGNAASTDPSISDSGRYVSFTSNATNLVSGDTNSVSDILMRDRSRNFTTRISTKQMLEQNPNLSLSSRISGNGRYVTFRTDGAISPDDHDSNGRLDVYVRDAIVPTLTSITTSSGARGTTANYTFAGTNFLGGTTIVMPNNIVVNSVTIIDEKTLTVNLTIPANAPTGLITGYVETEGTIGTNTGAVGQCKCFTVT
jgi:hypothetical protein